ncbi:ABC-2 type transport system ATP-binding protein [Paenibacillus mucilaginosus]|uniref:ABC transporter ATP-binding protein n=1 Tax=Paenibacillus mucilaginosus TaxID=61624 RepID=UPI003D1F3916
MYLIRVREAVKSYGGRKVLNGISIDIREGEVLAVIGPNGAGKSTLIDMMLGIRFLDGGEVIHWSDRTKGAIGVQFQTPTFFPGLSSFDNLKLFAALNGLLVSDGEIRSVLARCHLEDAGWMDAYRLSGGQQKRLAIAIALIHQPRLLVLDEPTTALDPAARGEIRAMIAGLAAVHSMSVVFTSHDMYEVRKLADRVVFVMNGKISREGTVEELMKDSGAADPEEMYHILLDKGREL